jgi:hypothetical protein
MSFHSTDKLNDVMQWPKLSKNFDLNLNGRQFTNVLTLQFYW